jgi:uncharacterized damage-inducible protein DinB
MKQMAWLDRRFPPETPPALAPGILERLRGTPARLEERIRPLPPAILTERPEDAWSIQENAGHLLKVEALWTGRLEDFSRKLERLRAADMSNRATAEADFHAMPIDRILADFRSARSDLVARIEGLAPEVHEWRALHPRLGQPMRPVDLMLFAAEHDDHHLARISEILRLLDHGRRPPPAR